MSIQSNVEFIGSGTPLLRVRESAHAILPRCAPDRKIVVEAVVRPYRGDRVLRRIPLRGTDFGCIRPLRIVVSDGDTLDRMRRGPFYFWPASDLASTIAQLNQEAFEQPDLCFAPESEPEARIGDKIMPSLPLSVMNVMDGMRSPHRKCRYRANLARGRGFSRA